MENRTTKQHHQKAYKNNNKIKTTDVEEKMREMANPDVTLKSHTV